MSANPIVETSRPTRRARARRGRLAPWIAGVLLLGCGTSPTGSNQPVSRIVVTPGSLTLGSVGETGQLSAVAFGPGGPVIGADIQWASADPTVASVVGRGATATVTAVGAGTTEVTATVGAALASVTVEVTLQPDSIAVTPSTLDLEEGGSATLAATLFDSGGDPIPGATFAWASSAPQTVSVDAGGTVVALQVGSAFVTATSSGLSGSAEVTVLPTADSIVVTPDSAALAVGEQTRFNATVLDGQGNVLAGYPVVWSVGNGSIASVDDTGLATALSPGVTTVRASVANGTAGVGVLSVAAAPALASFTDDFEDGSLARWAVGGRRLGNYVTDVVDRGGDKVGHLFQSSFTEVTLEKDLQFGSQFRLAFSMETALTSSSGGTSTFYSSGGVRVHFLDATDAVVGWISYIASTSTHALQACTTANCAVNLVAEGGPTSYDVTARDLLDQITVDETSIVTVRVAFRGYASAYTGSLSAHVWIDDVRFERDGW